MRQIQLWWYMKIDNKTVKWYAIGCFVIVAIIVFVGFLTEWLVDTPPARAAQIAMTETEWQECQREGCEYPFPQVSIPDDISLERCIRTVDSEDEQIYDCGEQFANFDIMENVANGIHPVIEYEGKSYTVLVTHWHGPSRCCGYTHIIASGRCNGPSYYVSRLYHNVGSVQTWGGCKGAWFEHYDFGGWEWHWTGYAPTAPSGIDSLRVDS